MKVCLVLSVGPEESGQKKGISFQAVLMCLKKSFFWKVDLLVVHVVHTSHSMCTEARGQPCGSGFLSPPPLWAQWTQITRWRQPASLPAQPSSSGCLAEAKSHWCHLHMALWKRWEKLVPRITAVWLWWHLDFECLASKTAKEKNCCSFKPTSLARLDFTIYLIPFFQSPLPLPTDISRQPIFLLFFCFVL